MKKKRFKIFTTILIFTGLLVVFYGCSIKYRYGLYSGLLMGEATTTSKGLILAEQLGYSKDSILLIVHADDIGMHVDQTDGTFDAMKKGMVKTGSVMVPCPDFNRVAMIWKDNANLDLGIHLTLNSDWGKKYGWGAVLPKNQVPSLYNAEGNLWGTPNDLRAHMDVDEAALEFEAQIVKVLQAGIKPTHMDAHYGNYYDSSDLASRVMQLSKKYNLPMKPHRMHRKKMRKLGYVFPDSMWMFFVLYGEKSNPDVRKRVYDNWLKELQPGVHEVVIHPSYMSSQWSSIVGNFNSYLRKGDYKYWSDPETKALAEKLGIIFIGYRELQLLQTKNHSKHFEKSNI
ncbi:MAG: ChbG/HpnK family deacetylase, partial [Desulfobacterales bacterium]|nr:ChbG/HpnK family deacetylase [Desulfobacterales bacterium]